mmetsp:Transcript_26326/g.25507  ORF Transcript_26326/g.25507 Transcript_26326/m.25507 type:complete len:80 (+) Transcript_26326:16-255(+)
MFSKSVKRLGIVGVGTVGTGVGIVGSSVGGYEVKFLGRSQHGMERSQNQVKKYFQRAESKGKLSKEQVEEMMGRISYSN